VRVDIADYYVKVSACWLKLLLPSSERDFSFKLTYLVDLSCSECVARGVVTY